MAKVSPIPPDVFKAFQKRIHFRNEIEREMDEVQSRIRQKREETFGAFRKAVAEQAGVNMEKLLADGRRRHRAQRRLVQQVGSGTALSHGVLSAGCAPPTLPWLGPRCVTAYCTVVGSSSPSSALAAVAINSASLISSWMALRMVTSCDCIGRPKALSNRAVAAAHLAAGAAGARRRAG
jgi:hypothetical protein